MNHWTPKMNLRNFKKVKNKMKLFGANKCYKDIHRIKYKNKNKEVKASTFKT